MALTTTTLTSAVLLNDKTIAVTSATGILPGHKVLIDGEEMEVTKEGATGLIVPVLRGRGATPQAAHATTSNVTFGAASDFSSPAPGNDPTTYSTGVTFFKTSVTTTPSTLALPPANCIAIVTLNGTAAITLTIPVPTKDMDGTILILLSNGVAQHVYTFTSGLGGVGSGYTTVTGASGARCSLMVIACNGFWNAISAPGWSSTVTKVTGAIGG